MGNGRLGAMYFGGVKEDRPQFNEETYWTGGPYDSVPTGAHQHLAKVRELFQVTLQRLFQCDAG